MKDVKIVFTDLDSTLTKENGTIDIENKAIFEKLASVGIFVVLNTGRPLTYTIPICKQFNTSGYVITSNGAEIYNIVNKKVIYNNTINKDNLAKLDEFVKKYDLFFVANSIQKRYTNKNDDNTGFVVVSSLLDIDDEISQVVLESYNLENMKYLNRDIKENTTLKIANKTKHIFEGKLLYYDVVNKEVSKGDALVRLCEYLNIDKSKAMAIGDSSNDIDMLKEAGFKVAVANASDEVKKLADVVTLSSKENGVKLVLDELYSQVN